MDLENLQKKKQEDVLRLLNQFDRKDVFLAPMAYVNDFAFRRLCREKGCVKLCWTGFVMSHVWVNEKDESKKREIFHTDGHEKNLVIQLLGSNEEELIQTAKELEKYCDMIDLNLGCTHCFASKSESGCFMIENKKRRERTLEIIKHMSNNLIKPLSCKLRGVTDLEGNLDIKETVDFVKKLEENGVNLITIHGRKNSSDKSGEINYDLISEVVKNVNIPVIANGGISTEEDVINMLEKTGACHIMAAQCFVQNPMHFTNPSLSPSEIGLEYIKYATETGETINQIKKHMFNFYSNYLKTNPEKANDIRNCFTIQSLIDFCENNK